MEQEGGFLQVGGSEKNVGRDSTPLPLPGGGDSPKKPKIGGACRQRLNVLLALIRDLRRSADELGHRGYRSAAWLFEHKRLGAELDEEVRFHWNAKLGTPQSWHESSSGAVCGLRNSEA